jgi:hypothetical protein
VGLRFTRGQCHGACLSTPGVNYLCEGTGDYTTLHVVEPPRCSMTSGPTTVCAGVSASYSAASTWAPTNLGIYRSGVGPANSWTSYYLNPAPGTAPSIPFLLLVLFVGCNADGNGYQCTLTLVYPALVLRRE